MILIYFCSIKYTWLETISVRLGMMLRSQLHETKIISEKVVNKASKGFNWDNLVGCGIHGSVYKGILDNGTLVSFKFIHSATS